MLYVPVLEDILVRVYICRVDDALPVTRGIPPKIALWIRLNSIAGEYKCHGSGEKIRK
jgi:hypothetical protein